MLPPWEQILAGSTRNPVGGGEIKTRTPAGVEINTRNLVGVKNQNEKPSQGKVHSKELVWQHQI
jgi:hypothetical protein